MNPQERKEQNDPRFGVRGHVRASKAATCRRTPTKNHLKPMPKLLKIPGFVRIDPTR